jgi:hypothetical protein
MIFRSSPDQLISADNYAWPPWAPDWLRERVASPDSSGGTHPCLRQLAKWLVIYFAECEGSAQRWLKHAAVLCDREVPEDEIERLLIWAEGLFGQGESDPQNTTANSTTSAKADLEEIYRIAQRGPRLAEFRASSPQQSCGSRKTDQILDAWGNYSGESDPWICFGADDRFFTRRHSAVRGILHVHAQIVPSPMRQQFGLTQAGYPSQHTKEGTGERMFLVTEFDFAKTTPKGQPTMWVALLERTKALGMTVLDLNAALLAELARTRPLWMVVYSGGKSLQGWFPCRGEPEEQLQYWFNSQARRLGADPMTWCKSQFVRMPDGTRAPNREGKCVRQLIEFFNPSVL